MSRSLHVRAVNRHLRLALALVLLVCLPAGTLRWWQGWVFVAVFWLCSTGITVYLAINDPQLLERRIKISTGPYAFVRHPMYSAAIVVGAAR